MNIKYLIAIKTATGKNRIYQFSSEQKRNNFLRELKKFGVKYALSEVRT